MWGHPCETHLALSIPPNACVSRTPIGSKSYFFFNKKIADTYKLREQKWPKKQTQRERQRERENRINWTRNLIMQTYHYCLGSEAKAWSHPLFPANYKCCADFLKFVFMVMLVIFGRGMSPWTHVVVDSRCLHILIRPLFYFLSMCT